MAWSLALTVLFVIFEAGAGVQAHSLALLSDAGHNFTDAFALALAALGLHLQGRPASDNKTYGYQRAGVLAAFVNALMLVGLALVLFYESWHRLMHPEPVAQNVMILVAGVGLALNLFIVWRLGGLHTHDLNMRGAILHMAGDAASSAAIIFGAIVIRFTGWLAVDAVLSMLIGLGVVWSAVGIIRDSLNILLEGLPKGLKLADVSREMCAVPGVIDVHDLHIWSLGSEHHALSSHVLIEDMPPSASEAILRELNQMLMARFAIHHSTVQFEHLPCELADAPCTDQARQRGK